jgi:hypothetical protein
MRYGEPQVGAASACPVTVGYRGAGAVAATCIRQRRSRGIHAGTVCEPHPWAHTIGSSLSNDSLSSDVSLPLAGRVGGTHGHGHRGHTRGAAAFSLALFAPLFS